MTYQLPKPRHYNLHPDPLYTAGQMQEAYTAGAASRDTEIAEAKAKQVRQAPCAHQCEAQAFKIEKKKKKKQIEGWKLDQKENLRWQCDLQASVFRKDALLQQALALLDKQWKCDGLWSLEDCQELAESIKEKLSK